MLQGSREQGVGGSRLKMKKEGQMWIFGMTIIFGLSKIPFLAWMEAGSVALLDPAPRCHPSSLCSSSFVLNLIICSLRYPTPIVAHIAASCLFTQHSPHAC